MIRCLALAFLLLARPQEKVIPGPGIPVPEKDRAELEAGLKELATAIDTVKSHKLAPDVMIHHKALDWALRYNEFYAPKEIPAAKEILKKGLERAAALKEGKAPWHLQTGLVVRGYRSRIDDSVQPYGLVVPNSVRPGDGKKYRLDFWLHGRDERLTELKFIDLRSKSPGEFAPPDTFVLHLYGRFCNASKFAGEADLFEALSDVQKHYPIDENRMVVRGFSMGGASAWHFAAHHAGRWAAASPGAGFAETPVYARMFSDPVKPTDYEQKLWHWYNATDYAANLFNCPVVAYSGEDDPQKAAADTMARAMKDEGLDLVHVIGPKTGHKYEPGAKKEVARRVDDLAAKGREPLPSRVRFTTWTLRYNRTHWLRVDHLREHWKRATAEAEIVLPDTVRIRTENVAGFTLGFDAGTSPFPPKSRPKVLWNDNPPKTLTAVADDRSWEFCVEPPLEKLHKRHGLQGPIDDAFMDRFVFVLPTGKPMNTPLGDWVAREQREAVAAWRRTLRGDVRLVRDTELPEADVAGSHLVLWGDPSSNAVLARIVDKLPFRWNADGLEVDRKTYAADRHIPLLVYPNPLNPQRYVVLNSGFTWKENAGLSNARHVPLLPDWAVLDITVPPTKRMSERVVRAGFFGERWELRD